MHWIFMNSHWWVAGLHVERFWMFWRKRLANLKIEGFRPPLLQRSVMICRRWPLRSSRMCRRTAQPRYGSILKPVGSSSIKVHCSGNTVKPVHSSLLHDELDRLAYTGTLKSFNLQPILGCGRVLKPIGFSFIIKVHSLGNTVNIVHSALLHDEWTNWYIYSLKSSNTLTVVCCRWSQ